MAHTGDQMPTTVFDSLYGGNSVKEERSRAHEVTRWEDVEAKTFGSWRAVLQALMFIVSGMKLRLH